MHNGNKLSRPYHVELISSKAVLPLKLFNITHVLAAQAALMTRRIVWDISPGIKYKFKIVSVSNGVPSEEVSAYERMRELIHI